MAEQMDKARVVPGRLIVVANTKRPKFTTARRYYHAVWVEDADGGNERCLLLTDSELKRIEARSQKNREDWPKKSFLQDLID